MKLYFENSQGRRRLLGVCETEKDAVRHICRFCDEHNFIIHYMRFVDSTNFRWYDVGSHSEFFYLYYEEDERDRLNHF